jgi:crotonyl-CoA carboxylase/reductase
VLVYVMAAGINYNNVWAGLGIPIDVIGARNKQGEPEPFHIGGSDASGIVYKVGKDVTNVKVGDEVVIHCGCGAATTPGSRPATTRCTRRPSGSGATRPTGAASPSSPRCRPPVHAQAQAPDWEEAAAYTLVGATAYRMLHGWPEQLRQGDPVLIWGGAGGLGSMAIQIAKAAGAVPVAVGPTRTSSTTARSWAPRAASTARTSTTGGMLPHWKDTVGYGKWLKGVRKFGKAFWDVLGDKRAPTIVFEHPGETTIPTSIFVCDTGGMVVICAGTTGYNATVDLRYLWMRQKRSRARTSPTTSSPTR